VGGGVASVLAAKMATSTIPIIFMSSDPLRFGLITSLSRPTGNLTGVSMFTGVASVLAAKMATSTIPIIFMSSDPLRFGLITSLSRPTGNLTGVSMFTASIGAKRFELLRELVPDHRVIAFLIDPQSPTTKAELAAMTTAAPAIGQQLSVLEARTEKEIAAAFAALDEQHFSALIVSADTFYTNQRSQFITLAAHYRIPTIYFQREFTVDGGLISYGNDLADAYRQVGIYTARILNGAKPSDLPVVQPTKFELVINLTTAKALGLKVPITLQVAADEMIE
jgi:putative ABC transport system substrate-binding protein